MITRVSLVDVVNRMSTKLGNPHGAPNPVDRAGNDGRIGLSSCVKWVSTDPSSEEMAELAQRFSEVVKLLEDKVKGEMDEWLAKGLVA